MALVLAAGDSPLASFKDMVFAHTIPCDQTAADASVESIADAILAAAKKGGAAVLGDIGGRTAAVASRLLGARTHVLVHDVNYCSAPEWEGLERDAGRAGVRLRCGSQRLRFSSKFRLMRPYIGSSLLVAVECPHAPDGLQGAMSEGLALGADVAMAAFDTGPQAVFACSPPGGQDGDRSIGVNASFMVRFAGDSAVMVSLEGKLVDIGPDVIADVDPCAVRVVRRAGGPKLINLASSESHLSIPEAMLEELESGIDSVETQNRVQDPGQACPKKPTMRDCLLPLPSRLAHLIEAIIVSINTGAPVYLDQR